MYPGRERTYTRFSAMKEREQQVSGRAKVAGRGRSLGNFPEAQFALNYVRLSLPLSSQLSKIMAISTKPKW